jgi:tetratricopeptide (TPR) repeat protein
MGVEEMEDQNIAYDPYLRDLREGFFYFQNADLYEDATEQQFEAFSRALEAQPDSLDDWYINQLYIASAEQFGEEIPNPDRAEFINQLASVVDDPALKQNYEQYATYIATEPSAVDVVATGGAVGGPDTVVQSLLDDLASGSLTGNRVLILLATAQRQPERIEALGSDPEDVTSQITRLPEIEAAVDNPRTLYALAVRAYREGDRTRGNGLFDRAIANASSNAQRADFYYSRGAGSYGSASDFTRALEYFPSHGPSLYRRGGPGGTPRGPFAYWCLADIYRNVAAASTDGRITSASRRAAAQYERAGPTREQYFLDGFRPGDSVTASLGAYGSCTTRVR